MYCEDHRRHDPVVPHGHYQGVYYQPFPSNSYLQTEEHQQAGADPTKPAADLQVRGSNNRTAELQQARLWSKLVYSK